MCILLTLNKHLTDDSDVAAAIMRNGTLYFYTIV